MKYCKNCGASLNETADSCPVCGTKAEESQETEEPVSFAMPQTKESNSSAIPDFISEAVPEKPKRHNKKILAAVIAVFLVIVGVGAIAYASSGSFKNSMKQAIMEPDEYLQSIFEHSVEELAKEASEHYSAFLTPMTNQTKDLDSHYVADVDLTLNQEFLAPFLESVQLSNVKLESISANITSSRKDEKVGGQVLASVNGQALASLNLSADPKEGILYLQIPELSPSYLKLDASDLESFEGVSNSMQLQQMIDSIFNESTLSSEDVKRILTEYPNLFVDMLTDVSVEKDVTAEASGVETSYDKYNVSINEKQLKDFSIAFLTKAKEDEKLLGFLDNMLQVIARSSETSSELPPSFRSNIDEWLKKVEAKEVKEEVTAATLSLWINETGEIKGEEFTLLGNENDSAAYSFGYLSTQKKKQHGLSFWGKENENLLFNLDSDSIEKDDKYSGSAQLALFQEDWYTNTPQTNTITVDFKDVTTENGLSGTFTASSTLIPGGSLILSLSGTEKEQNMELGINYMGMSIGTLTIHQSSDTNAEPITFPSESDRIYSIQEDGKELSEYLEECDIEALLQKLSNSIGINFNSPF